jgi:SET domain-containing protein
MKTIPQKPYVVRNSPVHGRGVFAARDITKGERILEYRGTRTSFSEAREHDLSDPTDPFHTFIMETSDGSVIDAGRKGNAARYINHSCDGNCKAYEEENGEVWIYARKNVKAGAELAYDYGLTFPFKLTKKAKAAFACRCGSKKCRGTMLASGQA